MLYISSLHQAASGSSRRTAILPNAQDAMRHCAFAVSCLPYSCRSRFYMSGCLYWFPSIFRGQSFSRLPWFRWCSLQHSLPYS